MPPKPKFTKEQIVSVALDIVRDGNVEAITAQEMGKRLGTSTRPMFTYFDTVEELRQETTDAAWRLYDERVQQGLSFTPAFKGFAMPTSASPSRSRVSSGCSSCVSLRRRASPSSSTGKDTSTKCSTP